MRTAGITVAGITAITAGIAAIDVATTTGDMDIIAIIVAIGAAAIMQRAAGTAGLSGATIIAYVAAIDTNRGSGSHERG
jgi:hypothetical protein